MKVYEGLKKSIKNSAIWYFGVLAIALLISFLLGQKLDGNYREIIICSVIVIVLFIVLGIDIWAKLELHQLAFVFIVCAGVLSLLIQPIFNIPDEVAHFARAEYTSRGKIFIDTDITEYGSIQSFADLTKNQQKTYVSSDLHGKKIDYTETKTDHIAAGNATLLYVPQAIGVLIAKILNLDVIWMLWLARLGNLIYYALNIYFALKIAPKLKFVLLFISALPMSVQQAASCSPDAVINASAILLIAYFLSLYCSERKRIECKQIVIFTVLSMLVTVSKVTNMFLGGLILLIPSEKFQSRKKEYFFKSLIIIGVLIAATLQYFYTTLFPAGAEMLEFFQNNNINSMKQIQYIFTHFGEWIQDFGFTLINNSEYYMNTLGMFGRLDYGISLIPIIIMFMFGKLCVQEQGIGFNKGNKVLIFLMVVGTYVLTCLALYISWSPVGGTEVLGVQGRYFIPLLALASLMFTSEGVPGQQRRLGDLTTMLSINGAMLIVTALRYY